MNSNWKSDNQRGILLMWICEAIVDKLCHGGKINSLLKSKNLFHNSFLEKKMWL